MSTSLLSLRQQLDDIDRRLVEVLAKRQQIITEVAALKADPALPLKDATRERDLLARVSQLAAKHGLDS